MMRYMAVISVLTLVGCADQSRGAALNECRQKYFLDSPAAQSRLIPECMAPKSFQAVSACAPTLDEHEWDSQVKTFVYDNPQCYRPLGSTTWMATALSPM